MAFPVPPKIPAPGIYNAAVPVPTLPQAPYAAAVPAPTIPAANGVSHAPTKVKSRTPAQIVASYVSIVKEHLFLKADGTPGELKPTGMGGYFRKNPGSIYHLGFHFVGTEHAIRTLLSQPVVQQALRSQGLDPNVWDPSEIVSATNYETLKKDPTSKLYRLLETSKTPQKDLAALVAELDINVKALKATKSTYLIHDDPVRGMRLRMEEAKAEGRVLNVSKFTPDTHEARKVARPKTQKATKSAIERFALCSDNADGIRHFLNYIGESPASIEAALSEWTPPTTVAAV
jgi:hypothetical protein